MFDFEDTIQNGIATMLLAIFICCVDQPTIVSCSIGNFPMGKMVQCTNQRAQESSGVPQALECFKIKIALGQKSLSQRDF